MVASRAGAAADEGPEAVDDILGSARSDVAQVDARTVEGEGHAQPGSAYHGQPGRDPLLHPLCEELIRARAGKGSRKDGVEERGPGSG